jgi:hypothetical protein
MGFFPGSFKQTCRSTQFSGGTISFTDQHGKNVPKLAGCTQKFVHVQNQHHVDDVIQHLCSSPVGWELKSPDLLVNITGDVSQNEKKSREYLKTAVTEFCKMTNNTWIITDGYSSEFDYSIGTSIRQIAKKYNSVKNEEANINITCIGFSSWDNVNGHECLENDTVKYDIQKINNSEEQKSKGAWVYDVACPKG